MSVVGNLPHNVCSYSYDPKSYVTKNRPMCFYLVVQQDIFICISDPLSAWVLLFYCLGCSHCQKPAAYRILAAWLGHERESVTQRAISKLCPHEPHPLVHYWMCFYIGKCCSVRSTWPLSGIRRCQLFGSKKCTACTGVAVGIHPQWSVIRRRSAIGGVIIGGSTVFSKLLFLSCTRGVYISHLAIWF